MEQYTHCANHRLNLVIVDVAKSIEEADLFFNLLQELYGFFSSSVVHSKFIELQKEVLNTKKPVELKRLCLTRWSSQVYCCKAIRSTLTIVLLLLNKLSFSTNIERSLEAEGLLRKIDFKLIYLLLVFYDILSQIQILSKYLQDVKADMANRIILAESTKKYFLELRNPEKHKLFYNEATNISKNCNITHPSEKVKQRRIKKIPKGLEKFVYENSTMEILVPTEENEFRSGIFYCILDEITNELDKRFGDNSDIISGISALNPESITILTYDTILPFAKAYLGDIECLKSELKILHKSMNRYETKNNLKIKDFFQFHNFLKEYEIAFSETYKLCSIAITIPVSSAACERTFSCMKRVKSYLRNSLLDTNLTSLSIISIEKREAKSLDIDEIINKFADTHSNRRIILK